MMAPIESTTDPTTRLEFDDAFRRRLRELLTWRRDVRRFRRDALPSGTLERLIGLACLAPSVGLSQPWRFVLVDTPACRAAIRANFERCNAKALAEQSGDRAAGYARLKLAGLDEAPGQLAVFADPATTRGHGLGRHTMPEMIEYSAVTAVHTIWLAARSEGIGMGWVRSLTPLPSPPSSMFPRPGSSSAICASDFRKPKMMFPSWNAQAGSSVIRRRRWSSCGASA
jgi:5,6-dimethylbenzimidazole synthase